MGVIWMMLIRLGLLLFLWLHERGIQRNCQRYRRTYQTTNKMTLLLLQLWDGDNDPGRQQRRLQERELWLLRRELGECSSGGDIRRLRERRPCWTATTA